MSQRNIPLAISYTFSLFSFPFFFFPSRHSLSRIPFVFTHLSFSLGVLIARDATRIPRTRKKEKEKFSLSLSLSSVVFSSLFSFILLLPFRPFPCSTYNTFLSPMFICRSAMNTHEIMLRRVRISSIGSDSGRICLIKFHRKKKTRPGLAEPNRRLPGLSPLFSIRSFVFSFRPI